ncbi:MAG TPA: hypothetical protein VKT20_10455 [Candidatus Dormibacteraeota bacterium]|nr:hypothetical protein [Candidatus Dormibacteraeota bacterium]
MPERQRHGPADTAFPPPGGPWEPLAIGGRLVGWGERAGIAAARRSAELGQQLEEEERVHLVGRLGHKLRSAVLALQETSRQAAFGRPELLETVYDQAQEVARRAAALEAAAAVPKERARGVVLGAVVNLTLPGAARALPADATVIGSEPALVEAFSRLRDWVGSEGLVVEADQLGNWWKVSLRSEGTRQALPVPEMGEPLIRLLVDTRLEGWLDSSPADGADVYLPAYSAK